MIPESTVVWSGGLPGYGDLNEHDYCISVPNEKKLVRSYGYMPLPEAANWVEMSEAGQIAWQGHESGLVYLGTEPVHKGYGQHSFLFADEHLHILRDPEDKELFQTTAGGWRYFGDDGHLVDYGPTYSGPPLWEWTEHAGVRVGQGGNGGLYVLIDGRIRSLAEGSWQFIKFRVYGDRYRVLGVNDVEHKTCVWTCTRAQLAALPLAQAETPAPPSTNPPVRGGTVTDIPNHLSDVRRVRAHYPTPLGASHSAFLIELAQAVGGRLLRKDSGTHVTLPNGTNVSQDIVVIGNQGFDILQDGEGQAVPTWNMSDTFGEDRLVDVSGLTPGTGAGESQPPPPAPGVTVEQVQAMIAAATRNFATRTDVEALAAANATLTGQLTEQIARVDALSKPESKTVSTSRVWGHSHEVKIG